MTFAAWLWSHKTLLDIVIFDPYVRATVSVNQCSRSKLSCYKERLQNGSLDVLIKLYYEGIATLSPHLTAQIKTKENKERIYFYERLCFYKQIGNSLFLMLLLQGVQLSQCLQSLSR